MGKKNQAKGIQGMALKNILIDTDILIDFIKDNDSAVQCLELLEKEYNLYISSITYLELLIGARNKKDLENLDEFANTFNILHLNQSISEKAIELVKLYRLNKGLLLADGLIASTAIIYDMGLITKNQKDFKFITGLDLIKYPVMK